MGVIKSAVLFLLLSAVDIYQYLNNEKPNIDYVLLIMAIVAAIVGSSVRVAYEGEKTRVSRKRIVFIYICSLAVSYMIYETTKAYGYTNIIGVLSIIGGIISVDLIKFFIEELPSIISDFIRKKASLKDKKDDGDSSI